MNREIHVRICERLGVKYPGRLGYCKDDNRKGQYPKVKFDFLGYCFRPRQVMRDNVLF